METITENTALQDAQHRIATQLSDFIAGYYVCEDAVLRLFYHQGIQRLIHLGVEEYDMSPTMIGAIVDAVA